MPAREARGEAGAPGSRALRGSHGPRGRGVGLSPGAWEGRQAREKGLGAGRGSGGRETAVSVTSIPLRKPRGGHPSLSGAPAPLGAAGQWPFQPRLTDSGGFSVPPLRGLTMRCSLGNNCGGPACCFGARAVGRDPEEPISGSSTIRKDLGKEEGVQMTECSAPATRGPGREAFRLQWGLGVSRFAPMNDSPFECSRICYSFRVLNFASSSSL